MESFLLKIVPFGEFASSVVTCLFVIAMYYKLTGKLDVHVLMIDTITKNAAKTDERSKHALKISKKAIQVTSITQREVKKLSEKYERRKQDIRSKI